MSDTIFALASGSYRAGVAVVRVSGGGALQACRTLTGKNDFIPRMATLSRFAGIDHALVLYFQAPASFTGEDVVEFHLHGGRSVIDSLLAALGKMAGFRLADPGEFTRRAFENGKIDLTEAEAIADLIAAETEAQRLQALDQLSGSLSVIYRGWADRLTKILAHQEADIEFPEDDMPQGVSEGLQKQVHDLRQEIAAHLDDGRRGEIIRDGFRIAIIGAPNAGKSSLLNALARRDAAIVSAEAGTTRDVVEVHLDLGGYPVILADTAGLRETDNVIEKEGIRRAKIMADNADLKIALFESGVPRDAETQNMVDARTIVVRSKCDNAKDSTDGDVALSSLSGAGMPVLLQQLQERMKAMIGTRETPSPTRERHRQALDETQASLTRSLSANLPELAAEDLRLALRALGRITGRVHVEELLDRIFRDFCIGK